MRGDLIDHSASLPDIVNAYHKMAEGAADFSYGQIFDRGLDLLGDGLPDELKASVGESVKALAKLYMPSTAQKLAVFLKNTSSSVAMLGKDASKILMAAEAVGIDPDTTGLRLIRGSLTIEEARRYYRWSGLIFEARPGTIISGPADPRSYFGIYLPNQKLSAKSNFQTTITNKFYR